MSTRLTEITEALRVEMDCQHSARERALADGRKIIQLSSKTIKSIHRREFDAASQLLAEVMSLTKESIAFLKQFPSLRHGAFIQDAVKEYVEAATLLAIIQKTELPSRHDLGVEPQAYLNGLCEAASECRRFALDELRSGKPDEARRLADEMEDIYDELITFDYPDALTSGLRRSVDALRAVLERTQSDLAVTGMQLELIRELRESKS